MYICSMSQCHQQPQGTGLCGFYVAHHMNVMMARAYYEPTASSSVRLADFINLIVAIFLLLVPILIMVILT